MPVATALPSEWTQVEQPLIEQLVAMGWAALPGDIDDPAATERSSFRDVLLYDRLRDALRRVNPGPDGTPWLDESRVNQAISALEQIAATKLMESNEVVTRRLLEGIQVEGLPGWDDGRDQTVRFIDWDDVAANDFLAINQFRVDPAGRDAFSVPDLVLFVNGIPLVVIECKSPAATNPMEEGITQLLRYSNQRDWFEEEEGVEKLFHYNQILVSTFGLEARAACVGAGYEHFLEWKDTSPVPAAVVAEEMAGRQVRSQETLVAGMLRPAHLLDLARNFTLFAQAGPKRIKLVARYQQFRAVHESIRRLAEKTGQDRGGIIWHTQGSGKSLTMVFLIRKMRTLPELRRFKVVAVTDRQDLEKQLFETAQLTSDVVEKARSTDALKELLSRPGAGLVFAMIQKYQERDVETEVLNLDPSRPDRGVVYDRSPGYGMQRAAEPGARPASSSSLTVGGEDEFPELNTSAEILVLVDEAHRSQSSTLHANLRRALPNAAIIGFTGTPILMGQAQRTHEIFGPFIDRYTIRQSEEDGSTVPILYEGRTAHAELTDGRSLDQFFEDMFRERTAEELEAIKRRYATTGSVLEAPKLIAAKSRDILRHYIATVLPNGFKAQVVATSRPAAVRYQHALLEAHQEFLDRLDALPAAIRDLPPDQLEERDEETRFLVRAYDQLDTIRRLEFAVVVSGSGNDDPAWREWTEKGGQDHHIARFKRPLVHADPSKQDGLAFLCVRTMLLTGFDAPAEQALYLDRSMRGHELLQAIARVNRTHTGKTCGLVVDYIGVGAHLKQALAVYAEADVEGAMKDIRDELPRLRDRHQRALAVFHQRGVESIEDVTACVEVLREVKVRAEFVVRLKLFLESLDIVLPRPDALPYVRDAKILGFINKAAANLYRDGQLNLMGAGRKVRQLIDEHVMAQGIDPRVPPISILDAEFDEAVDSHVSPRTKASEMEHAARYHIRKHWHEDPAYYKKLSERLEEILQTFEDNWDRLVEALRDFTADVREGRPADESGLDPRTQAPFLGVLLEEVADDGSAPSSEMLNRLAAVTVEMVDHIRQEIRMVDFWRNQNAQEVLRMWVVRLLDDHDVVPFERQRAVAGRIMELAKARRETLLQ
jgi:type I restriction enzyme, R subunit